MTGEQEAAQQPYGTADRAAGGAFWRLVRKLTSPDGSAEVSQRPRLLSFFARTSADVEPPELPEADLLFLLRLGEVLLRCGAGSADVEASVVACADSLGHSDVQAAITYTQVQISLRDRRGGPPLTDMRIVRVRSADHQLLTNAHRLVLELLDSGLDAPSASARLDSMLARPRRYPRWVVSAGWGALSAAVVAQLGAGVQLCMLSFALSVALYRLGVFLARRGMPDFYLNAIGGAAATSVAAGLTAAGAQIQPSLLVAGGIVALLPGLTLVGTVSDAVMGFMVTAAGRAVEVMLLGAGIVGGVAGVLVLAEEAGVQMDVQATIDLQASALPIQFVAAGVLAAAVSVTMHAPPRLLPAAFALGSAGYTTFLAFTEVVDAPALGRAVVAVLLGLGCQLYATRFRYPVLTLAVPAITTMLPGLAIYAAMLQISQGSASVGLAGLVGAATQALALAAGVVLGQFVGQSAHRQLDSIERRYAGPQMVGASPAARRRERR